MGWLSLKVTANQEEDEGMWQNVLFPQRLQQGTGSAVEGACQCGHWMENSVHLCVEAGGGWRSPLYVAHSNAQILSSHGF